MPTVPKTSRSEIVAAARRIIEQEGLDSLSMQAVAQAVGVRGPSLYKHVADRAELVRAVVQDVGAEMRQTLEETAVTGSPKEDLRAMAAAQRSYALRSPNLYSLLFGTKRDETELSPAEYGQFVETLVDRVRRLGDPREALEGARMLVAFTHGFVSMELAGAFRLGGDLDKAFAFGLERLLEAIHPRDPQTEPKQTDS